MEVEAAVATLHRLLKPDGVLLATFPAVSQICRYDMDRWGDYWRFTSASVERLLGDAFGREQLGEYRTPSPAHPLIFRRRPL